MAALPAVACGSPPPVTPSFLLPGHRPPLAPGARPFLDASPDGGLLAHHPFRARAPPLSPIGLRVPGGGEAAGAPLAAAELSLESGQPFLRTPAPLLDGRVDPRAVVLPDGSPFTSGGRHTEAEPPLATTLVVA